MNFEQVELAVNGPDFCAGTEETLQGFEEGTVEQKQELRATVEKHKRHLLNALKGVEDLDDLKLSVTLNYIELKSHWIMLNIKLNYQTMKDGMPDMFGMYHASLISSMVGALESILTPYDIQNITNFLAEPVKKNTMPLK